MVPPKQSIIDMVDAMQRYNLPPSMDFVKYPDVVDPISMYIFEFEHKLNHQDLLNIWQNLPPRIARAFDPDDPIDTNDIVQTRTVSHTLEEGQLLNKIGDRLQWMVFKVKQRAQTNYFNKVVQDNYSLNIPSNVVRSGLVNLNVQQYSAGGAGAGGITKGEPYARSYNWPYDFFSLVELAKIDDEVMYSTVQNQAGQGVIRVPDQMTSLPAQFGTTLRQEERAIADTAAEVLFGQSQVRPGGVQQQDPAANAFETVMGATGVRPGGVQQQEVQGAVRALPRQGPSTVVRQQAQQAAQTAVSQAVTSAGNVVQAAQTQAAQTQAAPAVTRRVVRTYRNKPK